MFSSLSMVLKPLYVLANVLPFVSNIVEAGTGLIALAVGFIGCQSEKMKKAAPITFSGATPPPAG